jgi:hypothetical protein
MHMSDPTCATAILAMLALYPDCEMRVPDVWRELDEKWPQELVATTLDELVQSRELARITDAGVTWYSVALTKLDAADWPAE